MTQNNLKKSVSTIWKDPVWSEVIAAMLIAGGLGLWQFLSGKSFDALFGFLAILYKIPLWALIIWGFFTIYFAAVAIRMRIKNGASNASASAPITDQDDIVAILDAWWPKESNQPQDVAVDFRELEKKYNLQPGAAPAAISVVASKNYYKAKFTGANHATYEYDFARAYAYTYSGS